VTLLATEVSSICNKLPLSSNELFRHLYLDNQQDDKRANVAPCLINALRVLAVIALSRTHYLTICLFGGLFIDACYEVLLLLSFCYYSGRRMFGFLLK
jgi:hypothetical protein